MNRCPACHREYRTGRNVMLLGSTEDTFRLKGVRVCGTCAKNGITVVSSSVPAPTPAPVAAGMPRDAVYSVIRQLRVYAKTASAMAVRSRLVGSQEAHQSGRAEGFEGAIKLLEDWLDAH